MPKIIDNLKDKLLEETRRQVMEQGYENVNIRSIAAGCGVGVGTVYNYFPSKDALIAGFMVQDWMECLARIKGRIAEGATAEEVLMGIYEELKQFRSRFAAVFQSASPRMSAPPKQYHVILRSQIAELIRPYGDSDFAAEFVAEAMICWTVEGKRFEDIYEVIKKLLA